MALNALETLAGTPVSGGVFTAPYGTELPTDATTPLGDDFINLGFANEDGLNETFDRSTEPQKDWAGDQIRVLQSEVEVSYEIALLQVIDYEVLRVLYGDNAIERVAATETEGEKLTVRKTGEALENRVFAFEMADQGNKVRILVPMGQVTAQDDVTYAPGELASINITISAYKEPVSGAYSIMYVDKRKK